MISSSRMYHAAVPTMPPGLVDLMEGLAKNVLKSSPDNIYEFCAQHMKKLIEIRDGKASKKDSTSNEKVSTAVLNQNPDDAEVIKINEEDIECRNKTKKIEIDDKKLISTDEISLNAHQKANEIEIKQKEFQIEDDVLNKCAISENLNDNNITNDIIESLPKEQGSEMIDENSHTLAKSINENSVEISLLHENLVSTIDAKESEAVIEPVISTINIENVNTSINDEMINNLKECDDVNKDGEQLGPNEFNLDATDIQSIDKTIQCEDNLNLINDLDYSNSIKKDSSVDQVELNESNKINSLQNSINNSSNDVNQEVKINAPTENDEVHFEEKLHLKIPNESKDGSREMSIEVNNETNFVDLEKAAITIQKVFRAFLFKSKTLSTEELTNVDFNYLVDNEDKKDENDSSAANKERRSGISRMDTVLQTVNEEKSLSLSTDDSSTLTSAATIIQAHIRGFLVRCKMPFNKTTSTASVLDTDILSAASFDSDQNHHENKTVLNIHIVPEGDNFMSRDESFLTSVDLSLDGSPHQSSNLHPLGYDRTERRKQLKREDAIQSVTPPSNNSGKLSEELDCVKEIDLNDSNDEPNLQALEKNYVSKNIISEFEDRESETILKNTTIKLHEMKNISSDEADVITPFVSDESPSEDHGVNNTSKLLHSGEFHDVLPTIISRNKSSVVRGE